MLTAILIGIIVGLVIEIIRLQYRAHRTVEELRSLRKVVQVMIAEENKAYQETFRKVMDLEIQLQRIHRTGPTKEARWN